jgi:hypothetical protein
MRDIELNMFENRVLRRTLGPRADEVTENWTKLHNEELHNLYSSPSIIRMIKSRRLYKLLGICTTGGLWRRAHLHAVH